jgi:hypothetical protein
MTKASDSAEPFGPEFLDTARNPEFIEGLKAEGLVAGHQSLRKDLMTFLHYYIYLPIQIEYAFSRRTLFSWFFLG